MRNQFSKKFLELMSWVNDGLPDSESGHSQEFGHLNSFQQDGAKQATSVMNEVLGFALGNHWTMLNMEEQDIATRFFAGVDKTGTKAQSLGLAYRPIVESLGKWGGEGSFPRPSMLSIESSTSARVAVLLISFTEKTMKGWGEWSTAEFNLFGICPDHDEAQALIMSVSKAFRQLEDLANISADYAEGKGKDRSTGLADF